MRDRDDARSGRPIRLGPLRHPLPRFAAPGGRHDRRWHADQQESDTHSRRGAEPVAHPSSWDVGVGHVVLQSRPRPNS